MQATSIAGARSTTGARQSNPSSVGLPSQCNLRMSQLRYEPTRMITLRTR